MKVFITGASGAIGSALTRELLTHGHTVLALARSDRSASFLHTLRAEVVRGSLTDLSILAKAASECDAVAHLAFINEFEHYAENCAVDRAAIGAIGSALVASSEGETTAEIAAVEKTGDKAFVISSGTSLLPKGRLALESQPYDATDPFGALRGPAEDLALSFASKGNGVRVSVIRLPSVYGNGSLGWVALMLSSASENDVVPYIAEGDNRWCAAHARDVAVLYRLALENGGKGGKGGKGKGSIYHAVAEEGVRSKDVAEALGKKLGLPVKGMRVEEAQEVFGVLEANALGIDYPASSDMTREELGWEPKERGLLEWLGSEEFEAREVPGWSKADSKSS
ncbi:putative oxidoreductase [Astrocystis sublimbata]|nr:putative oxidoreductase [Astrocystis sublimbata]